MSREEDLQQAVLGTVIGGLIVAILVRAFIPWDSERRRRQRAADEAAELEAKLRAQRTP